MDRDELLYDQPVASDMRKRSKKKPKAKKNVLGPRDLISSPSDSNPGPGAVGTGLMTPAPTGVRAANTNETYVLDKGGERRANDIVRHNMRECACPTTRRLTSLGLREDVWPNRKFFIQP